MADATQLAPGRMCPVSYRYAPAVFDREPDLVADTLYVVGGLYGNVEALDAVLSMAAREPSALVVFNGDFHWFDIAPVDFERISKVAGRHACLRGNVETELVAETPGAGCGCAYPESVTDAEVDRSNAILARLRQTSRRFPAVRERLRGLPMHLVALVGDARIGIVHGDFESLAGWRFSQEALDDRANRTGIERAFRDGAVDVYASTHTCLPALRSFDFRHGRCVVANNGAAGMPNFAGERFGLVTRISIRPASDALYGVALAGTHVEALAVRYDTRAWQARFTRDWPEGSPAYRSYFERIAHGPRYSRRSATGVCAPLAGRAA